MEFNPLIDDPRERGILSFTQDKILQSISTDLHSHPHYFLSPHVLYPPARTYQAGQCWKSLEKHSQAHQIFGVWDCSLLPRPAAVTGTILSGFTQLGVGSRELLLTACHILQLTRLLNSSTGFFLATGAQLMEEKKAGEGRTEEPGVFPFFFFFFFSINTLAALSLG